jgi:hypothetical protein
VGKVCLHLAENRGDEDHPFAFLATYAVRAGAGGRVQHRPLAKALEESSARRDRQALLHLLVPLQWPPRAHKRIAAERLSAVFGIELEPAGPADRSRRGRPPAVRRRSRWSSARRRGRPGA